MRSLQKQTTLSKNLHRLGVAMALVLGLTVLSGLTAPLLDDEVASWLPVPTEALADEPHGGNG